MSSKHEIGASPFLKRVLVPFWIVRIVAMLLYIAIYALAIGLISYYEDNTRRVFGTNNTRGILAVAATVMTLVIICLLFDIVCIVKRIRRTLTPRFFLVVNVLQTTFWTIMFILSMIGISASDTAAIAIMVVI
jgi:hypothetical protein